MLLLRHASAGPRLSTPGIDRFRQLDQSGRAQARQLLWTLAGHTFERVVSSPFFRCVETVTPLAQSRHVPIEQRDELAPDASPADAERLLAELPDASLVCTHQEILDELFARELECEIAGGWVVERHDTLWVPVQYVAPPAVAGRPVSGAV